jgi:hypothetical protein
MGAAMMTRQGLSYTLWGMPVVAAGIQMARGERTAYGRRVGRMALQALAAGAIAGALWTPYLTAELGKFVRDAQAEAPAGETVTTGDIVRRRVLYQDKFSEAADRAAIVRRNASETFLPQWQDDRGREQTGWLWTYLTWPVYLAGVAGFVWLVVRGQWWVAAVAAAWLALMLGPVVVLGNVVYSRYVLAGAMVLVVTAGWLVADVLALAFLMKGRAGAVGAWGITAAALGGLLWMPLREIGRQATDWRHQTMVAHDRYQYLTGWTAGKATMAAVRAIDDVARKSEAPVVVITDTAWGLPADAAWVYLSRLPNVRVYFTSRSGEAILIPVEREVSGGKREFWLRPEKWLFLPQEPVEIEPEAGVFYITNDPIHASDGDHRAAEALGKWNPNLPEPWTFYGIEGPVSDMPGQPGADDQVQVFRLQ